MYQRFCSDCNHADKKASEDPCDECLEDENRPYYESK